MSAKVPTELVQRAALDRAALEELIGQYKGLVLSLARPRCLDAASAEDICQDVWIVVERELPKLREPKAFVGWLARITENATSHYLRRTSREKDARRELSGRQRGASEPPAETGPLMDERNQAVLKALRALPEDYRIPITLRFYQGMTAREIADVLNAPLGTVLSRLFRANAMLKERLRKYFD